MKPSKIHNVRVVATISVGVFLWLAVAQSQTTLPQPTKHVARNFRSVSVEAKSVFISTYNNPNDNSGLAYPEPPVDFNGVKEAIELWPTMTKSERDAVATLKRQVLQWNRYQVVSDPEKADFVMLVHFGRDFVDKPCEPNGFDCPQRLRSDDSLYLYSANVNPALLWHAAQAGGLHQHNGQASLLNELEGDVENRSASPPEDHFVR